MNFSLRLICLLFVVFTCSSCEKATTETIEDETIIPGAIKIDVDNDGATDFQIHYIEPIIYSPTIYKFIGCFLEINGTNEILAKTDEPILFLDNTEILNESISNPHEWSNAGRSISTYEQLTPTGATDTWAIACDEVKDSYFIGVRLNRNSITKIGWIELAIDNNTGDVTILDLVIL